MIDNFLGRVEICEMPEEDLAGRVKIKMSALKINKLNDESDYNTNGIHWEEQYIEDNIKSAIGMNYVVDWADEENQIPCGHGRQSYDSDGNVQFEGVVVGSVHEAYVSELEINGETIKVLMTEGYLNSQRYPKFIKWIKEEILVNQVHGSVEINGKGKSKKIVYLNGHLNDDGSIKMGRTPKIFDFSALAILSNLEEPADKSSIVFEINSKKDGFNINSKKSKGGEFPDMNKVANGRVVEINSLDSYQIEKMLLKAFRITIGDITDSYNCNYNYYVCKLYPLNSEFIVEKWTSGSEDKYYKATYSIDSNNNVTLGDIYEVEKGWIPINNEKAIEFNNKEGGNTDMELQAKYEALSTSYETMKCDYETMQKNMVEKDQKISEINEALVNANKMMEETNGKYETMAAEMKEINGKYETMMAEKATAEATAAQAAKEAEVNAYFETEITKNGFEESELNSLKTFVETFDLQGLKQAEAELCTKKIKEIAAKNAEIEQELETNSKKDMFISINPKEKKVIKGTMPTFFE